MKVVDYLLTRVDKRVSYSCASLVSTIYHYDGQPFVLRCLCHSRRSSSRRISTYEKCADNQIVD